MTGQQRADETASEGLSLSCSSLHSFPRRILAKFKNSAARSRSPLADAHACPSGLQGPQHGKFHPISNPFPALLAHWPVLAALPDRKSGDKRPLDAMGLASAGLALTRNTSRTVSNGTQTATLGMQS